MAMAMAMAMRFNNYYDNRQHADYALFDAPYKAAVKRAVNIADLCTIAKSRRLRAHKVSC